MLHYHSIAEAAALIERREISPVELTRATLERIEALDASLHAFITVSADFALERARLAEREIAAGHYRGPLHGIPFAAKDLFDTAGIRTTCGSKILRDRVPAKDATAIARLHDAGAVLVGKLVMTEFAGIGYHPGVVPPRNPWNANHWTGQSSSGSGVAAAAGLSFATLGTDTGGSLRYPASACGVVGVKPTWGRVSRHGVFPLAETLDSAGPITRTVEDACIVLHAIAGEDGLDPTSSRDPVPDYRAALGGDLPPLRVGLAESMLERVVDDEVKSAVEAAAGVIAGLGAVIEWLPVPMVDESVEAWGNLFVAECLLAHAEHYPARADDYSEALRLFLEQGSALAGTEYARAHLTRLAARRAVSRLFDTVDVLALPTMGRLPPPLTEFPASGIIPQESAGALLSFTAPFALTGHPAVSVPCGFSRGGLPIGLQLAGPHGSEALLLKVAGAYETATDWNERRPPLD